MLISPAPHPCLPPAHLMTQEVYRNYSHVQLWNTTESWLTSVCTVVVRFYSLHSIIIVILKMLFWWRVSIPWLNISWCPLTKTNNALHLRLSDTLDWKHTYKLNSTTMKLFQSYKVYSRHRSNRLVCWPSLAVGLARTAYGPGETIGLGSIGIGGSDAGWIATPHGLHKRLHLFKVRVSIGERKHLFFVRVAWRN